MKMFRIALPCLALFSLTVFGLSGCNQAATAPAESSTPETTSATEEHSHDHDHGDHDHAHGDHDHAAETAETELPADVVTALASLSDEDREIAVAQKTCPVGGSLLGSMGTPIKVDVNGKPVFICCKGCKEPLLESPEDFLADASKEETKPAATEAVTE